MYRTDKWLSVCLRTKWLWVGIPFCHFGTEFLFIKNFEFDTII